VESTVSSGHTTRLLIDCGFGLKHLEARLDSAGLQPADISALFITHEHGDHIGCAFAFAKRYKIPVWMSRGTQFAVGDRDWSGLLNTAQDGQCIDLQNMQLMPFTVPHDAREPLQLTCTDGQSKLGVVTDLGHSTPHVVSQLEQCHALLIECNHDSEMLAQSTYPPFLKQRVGGQLGHLSNLAAAEIVRKIRHSGLHTLLAAHLSAQNNTPDLARQALRDALAGNEEAITVADALEGSEWLTVLQQK
jgi:phosphoribosyl 1,2-cyclic phosphodiesterase